MQTDPDLMRAVRSWLGTDEHESAERVIAAVLRQLDTAPQRRSWWFTGRIPMRKNGIKLAAAAIGVVLVAVVGTSLLPGTSQHTGAPAATPSAPSPTPSAPAATQSAPVATPIAAATPAPCAFSTDTPTADSPAIPTGPMSAGQYHVDLNLCRYVTTAQFSGVRAEGGRSRITFDVPAGWSGNGSGILKDGGKPPAGLSIAPWTINRVYIAPCRTTGAEGHGGLADPPMMRTLDYLAEALSDWWVGGAQLPLGTKPTSTILAGLPALYVEIKTPHDLNFATCDGGVFTLWADENGQLRSVQGPGELDRVWVVDLPGSASKLPGGLLVIDAASFPGTSAADLAEVQSIVSSIKVELVGGS